MSLLSMTHKHEMVCFTCRREWLASTPAEHCNCGSENVYQKPRYTKEGLHWKCPCGNGLFMITESEVYCGHCDNTLAFNKVKR